MRLYKRCGLCPIVRAVGPAGLQAGLPVALRVANPALPNKAAAKGFAYGHR